MGGKCEETPVDFDEDKNAIMDSHQRGIERERDM
jgi:hypothetical protein